MTTANTGTFVQTVTTQIPSKFFAGSQVTRLIHAGAPKPEDVMQALSNNDSLLVTAGAHKDLIVLRAEGPFLLCFDADRRFVTIEAARVSSHTLTLGHGFDIAARQKIMMAQQLRHLFIPIWNDEGIHSAIPVTALVEYDSGMFTALDKNGRRIVHGTDFWIDVDGIDKAREEWALANAMRFLSHKNEFERKQTIYHRRTGEPVVVVRLCGVDRHRIRPEEEAMAYDMYVIDGAGTKPFKAHSFEYTADINSVNLNSPTIK